MGKGAKAYHRIKTRRAPHNGYTYTKALRARSSGSAVQARWRDAAAGAHVHRSDAGRRPRGRVIRRSGSRTGPTIIGYRYDRKSGLYRRAVDGRAQIDPADGKRVTTRNVVVLFQRYRIDTKIEPGHARPVVGSVGKGTAWIFREGKLVKGRWEKATDIAPTRLLDKDGKEIPLVRGRTFFQVVPTGTKVTHRARIAVARSGG